MTRMVFATAICLLGCSASGLADERTDSLLDGLKRGQHVQLQLAGGSRFESQVRDVTPERSTLQVVDRSEPIAVSSIDSFWVQKNAAETGAVVGALVLAVPAGLLAGYLAWGDNETNPKSDAPAIVGGAAVGALLGGMIGAAVGSGSKSWHLEYARSSISLGPPGTQVGVGIRLAF